MHIGPILESLKNVFLLGAASVLGAVMLSDEEHGIGTTIPRGMRCRREVRRDLSTTITDLPEQRHLWQDVHEAGERERDLLQVPHFFVGTLQPL